MSTLTITHVTCDRRGCTAAWHYSSEDLVDQQRRAGTRGWVSTYDGKHDYCPRHAAITERRGARP